MKDDIYISQGLNLVLLWTAIIAFAWVWNISDRRQEIIQQAVQMARVAYEKDVMYRIWNADHGGVYVPVTEHSRPNPYLSDVEERDIVSPSGRLLTLMNPAYMTRQVHEMSKDRFGISAHITSLNPIWEKNSPDEWEAEALKAFEQGEKEVFALRHIGGKEYMRLISPFFVEEQCMKCHQHQGYRVGMIRGGISVTVPMRHLRNIQSLYHRKIVCRYLFLWILGIAGIFFLLTNIGKQSRQRRNAEKALKESEERFRLFMENSPSPAWMKDEQGRCIYLNLACEKVLGLEPEKYLGKTDAEIYPPEIAKKFRENDLKVLESGQTLETIEESVTMDGRTVFGWVFKFLFTDMHGKRFVGGMGIDVTERRRAEESLRVSLEKYRVLFESFPAGITVADTAGRILESNQEAERILGLSPEVHHRRKINGKEWNIVRPDRTQMPDAEFASVRALKEQRIVSNVQMGLVKDKGAVTWLNVTAAPIPLAGYGVAIVYNDITEYKRAEDALRESERKFRFITERTNDLIYLYRLKPDPGFEYVSPAAERITGYTPEEHYDDPQLGFKIVHPDDAHLLQIFLNGEVNTAPLALRWRKKDGTVIWTETENIPLYDEAGELIAIQGKASDITERRLIQESLCSSEFRYRRLFEDAPIALWEEDFSETKQYLEKLKAGGISDFKAYFEAHPEEIGTCMSLMRVTDVNRAALLLYGARDKEELLSNLFRTFDPNSTAPLTAALVSLAEGNPFFETELVNYKLNGEAIVLLLRSLVSQDDQCSYARVIVAMLDLTARRQAEDALRESEEKYRFLTENMKDVVWILDTETLRFLYVSPSVEQLRGYTPEEVMSEPMDAALTPEHAAYVRQLLDKRVASFDEKSGQSKYNTEELLQPCKDGSLVWTEVITMSRRNPKNNRIEVYGVTRDISERKRAEESLARSNRLLEAVIRQAPFAVHVLDGDFSHIHVLIENDESRRIMGEHIEGRADIDANTPETLVSRFFTADGREEIPLAEMPSPRAFTGEYVTREEFLFCHPDGTEIIVEASASPVYDHANQLIAVVVTFHDITERKRAEEALKESEDRYRTLFEEAGDSIVVIDPETRKVVQFNKKVYENLGYTAEEFARLDVAGVDMHLPEQISGRFQEIIAQNNVKFETRHRAKNGELKDMLINASSILYKGKRMILGIGHDITELKLYRHHLEELIKARTAELYIAKEKAESANLAKSRFLANMSHELRTPLNIITGFSRIMQRDRNLDRSHREYLDTVVKSSEHLLGLINEVLEMSKIESGSIRLSESDFNLHQLLDLLESMYVFRAGEKGVRICFEISPETPCFIRSDEIKFRQVLLNLMSNAVKFTDQGHITVRVQYFESESRLFVEVEDTGQGIDPEETHLLFKPFGQTESGRRSPEGTGLGLPISKRYVELMGGEFFVESCPGKGSIFRFHIIAKRAEKGKEPEKTGGCRIIGLEPGQPLCRIAVAEDNEDNRNLICSLLRAVGFEIYEARNGQELLDLWKSKSLHLILTDMRMPVMDGYEAVRIIRRTGSGDSSHPSPLTSHLIPVIAVTAYAFEEDRKAVLAAGCDDFIRKPFKETELFEKIAFYLKIRYRYEEAPPRENSVRVELKPEDLAALPEEWLSELHDAAKRGKSEYILELIARIRTEHPAAADALSNWVKHWQFKKIAELAGGSGSGVRGQR